MRIRWSLWIALVLMAGGALLLHLRIHPLILASDPGNINMASLAAFMFPLIDLVLISALFMSPATSAYGLLLNGIFSIYATVLMGHLSVYEYFLRRPSFGTWLFTSTLPDIMLAWADFFVGCALFYVIQSSEPGRTK